jgi:protein SCO1/2
VRAWLAAALSCLLAAPALAHEPATAEEALAGSEAALGRVLPELGFVDTAGQARTLAEFRGRPLLVSLVYTACTDACPTLIENLYPAVEAAQEALGADAFSVITVGFDTRNDTPERMLSFVRARGVDLPGWHFLSGDHATIDALATAVGFTFYPSAGGFDHMAQVSVVDREGRLYQQVYGGVFETPQIVEPLKDLVFGRERSLLSLDGLVDRVRWLCTVYDPRSGRYYFDYSLFIGIAIGALSLLGLLAWLAREWLRPRADRPRVPGR